MRGVGLPFKAPNKAKLFDRLSPNPHFERARRTLMDSHSFEKQCYIPNRGWPTQGGVSQDGSFLNGFIAFDQRHELGPKALWGT